MVFSAAALDCLPERHCMHGFFSKIVALGLVASGFFLTGDLQWIMDRTGSWARGDASESEAATEDAATDTGSAEPAVEAPLAAANPTDPPAPVPTTAEVASPYEEPLPPGGVQLPGLTLQRIDTASLRAGDRILARTQHEVVAFDLIDPASREAIEHRHALLAADVATAAALTTPRRVLLPPSIFIGQAAAFPAAAGSQESAFPPAGGIDALGIEQPLD